MILIAHRRNTIKDLQQTNTKYGVEVDIRSSNHELIIHHDPFEDGENFEAWLNHYRHNTMILNVKEEGLEERLISLMDKKNLTNYFFLDQSFPFLVKWSGLGEKRCAVRISEYENIETALCLAERVSWVWLDCFTKFPINGIEASNLRALGFKLCLVSPELQGRDASKEIPIYASLIREEKIEIDAVCTKRMDVWESILSL